MATHPHLSHHSLPIAFRGRHASLYERVARRPLRGVYRRLAADAAAAAPPDGAVLDVGTGPGVLLAELARIRPDLRVVGIDLSADMVAAAKRSASGFGDRVTAQLGDVTDLPFPDGSFDLVVSSFSLHHWADPAAAVPELARVLRPGGRLHIYDFRFAPFDALTTTARNRSLFTGPPPERTRVPAGVPLLPRYTRLVMSAAQARASS